MRALTARLAAGSRIVGTPQGRVEFAARGDGPPVIVLHGAGGGYDQGMLIAEAFGGEGFRWIAVSRFGYLRSALPPDPSTAAQADALAGLLDHLGIERVSLLAMSGGVPPALQFARRHPGRTRGLVLLSSAPFTPLGAEQQDLPIPAWLYQALFGSDLPYWLLSKVARDTLLAIFDVSPQLRASLDPEEAAFVDRIVETFRPVTLRTAGLRNEGAAVDPSARYDLDSIAAPALVIHARDDGINPVGFGLYAARHLRDAEFIALDTGGHLLLGHHRTVRAAVRGFLASVSGD